jgi:hypothetical protein
VDAPTQHENELAWVQGNNSTQATKTGQSCPQRQSIVPREDQKLGTRRSQALCHDDTKYVLPAHCVRLTGESVRGFL